MAGAQGLDAATPSREGHKEFVGNMGAGICPSDSPRQRAAQAVEHIGAQAPLATCVAAQRPGRSAPAMQTRCEERGWLEVFLSIPYQVVRFGLESGHAPIARSGAQAKRRSRGRRPFSRSQPPRFWLGAGGGSPGMSESRLADYLEHIGRRLGHGTDSIARLVEEVGFGSSAMTKRGRALSAIQIQHEMRFDCHGRREKCTRHRSPMDVQILSGRAVP